MKKVIWILFGIMLLAFAWQVSLAATPAGELLTFRRGALVFNWDMHRDSAWVIRLPSRSPVWHGSLLPSFWLEVHHQKEFVKASLQSVTVISQRGSLAKERQPDTEELKLALRIGSLGLGYLKVIKEEWGIRFSLLEINWHDPVPAIITMYFGASDKALKCSLVHTTWDKPFLPDWQSLLFCVPGARAGTAQSYFRFWDFGQANVALGNFGPSMGSPYGAAFPRPVYYAAMGSDAGYIALGAGSIPGAAMSLRIASTRGCFEYMYREDLWGAAGSRSMTWKEPLRISLGENAWQAFKGYYSSFERKQRSSAAPPAIWNSWGMWGQGHYAIRPLADFARKEGAGILALDDGWQSSEGVAAPDLRRFPHFREDVAYVRQQGLDIGLWESVGWISDPFSQGLTREDLILDEKGRPCMANWNFDPAGKAFYCLDISSAKTRDYIRKRTLHLMQAFKPALLKLDFMYGLPSPEMGVPRDPAYRGERYGYALFHLIATVAKSVNPAVLIQGYSISPLWTADEDIVSLDDQGDLWYDMKQGHAQWSLWGSLLSDAGLRLCGSSGYRWELDDEGILNTCILGLPGAVLKIPDSSGSASERWMNRRLAVDRCFRRTLSWTPLWLNSYAGGYTAPPRLNCWGRLEENGSDTILTALILREDSEGLVEEEGSYRLADSLTRRYPVLEQVRWKGRWALISQDDKGIFSSRQLALIPFDPGQILLPCPTRPAGITRFGIEGQSVFDSWEWSGGMLMIQVTKALLSRTAGFLIDKNQQ